MKFQLNIEFDSLEEYLAFSRLIQPLGNLKVSAQSKQSKVTTPNAQPTVANPKVKQSKFKPPAEMLEQLSQFLQSGQPFRTADVMGENIMKIPTDVLKPINGYKITRS